MSQSFDIHQAIPILREEVRNLATPAVGRVAKKGRDPYRVLISCLLSLRTQDKTTWNASARLFQKADTPQAMIALSETEIREAIYPVGFYRRKAQVILDVSRTLLEQFGGKAPRDLDDLLSIRGVGRKTANLVLTVAYGLPGICVDTHVHRITNRWGYVQTKGPDATEIALRQHLPGEYWIELNDLLVPFGQAVCKPISPLCTTCPLDVMCPKLGVTRHR
ncbi:MAG: endonuclease III [Deltaproteobacteria bacterium]|nr:endonuclease III [Deltaproteobacteria bacterium]